MAERTLLLINKFYHETGPAGGVGRYILQEKQDLEAAGWRVIPFAMADEHVLPSRWSRFFVRAHDYSRPAYSVEGVRAAASLLWNREAARKLDALLHEARPDVAHLHNIYHHLSPSILPVLRRHGIPAAMTLHDLRLLCPAIHMRRRGEICERCRGGRFHEALLGRCVKDSFFASTLAAVETALQTRRGDYPATIDRFLCPSACYARKFAEWGYPEETLTHLPNFVDLEQWRPAEVEPERAYLYFGRLSAEKGLDTLLRAHHRLAAECRDADMEPPRLRLAGSGPDEPRLKRLAGELELDTVDFLGSLTPDALRIEIHRASFTVLPSQWYENGPLSLLESIAAGVPVIGARIGGIPEMIDEGIDGLLFASGDVTDLAGVLSGLFLASSEGLRTYRARLGVAARRRAERDHDRAGHMRRLREILDGLASR